MTRTAGGLVGKWEGRGRPQRVRPLGKTERDRRGRDSESRAGLITWRPKADGARRVRSFTSRL